MDIREKALLIRAKQADMERSYPDGCVMVSLQSGTYNTTGGQTVEVPVESAARHLVEGTHRLASEAEIKAFRGNQVELSRQIYATERTRSKVILVTRQSKLEES